MTVGTLFMIFIIMIYICCMYAYINKYRTFSTDLDYDPPLKNFCFILLLVTTVALIGRGGYKGGKFLYDNWDTPISKVKNNQNIKNK